MDGITNSSKKIEMYVTRSTHTDTLTTQDIQTIRNKTEDTEFDGDMVKTTTTIRIMFKLLEYGYRIRVSLCVSFYFISVFGRKKNDEYFCFCSEPRRFELVSRLRYNCWCHCRYCCYGSLNAILMRLYALFPKKYSIVPQFP